MMAFFMLLWLLNVSTDEQKEAISNYFDPTHPIVSDSKSGAGGVLGGLSVAPKGAMVTNVQSITSPEKSGNAVNNKSSKKQDGKEKGEGKGDKKSAIDNAIEKAKEARRKKENDSLKKAEAALKKAIEENADLAAMKENILIEITPEGLRIQIIDRDKKPMFASGSARMFQKTQKLLKEIGNIITKEPNHISIRGHTDSSPYGQGAKYTNWELSADRANASRRILLDSGYPADKLHDVVGKADTEHLYPEDPTKAGNRRVSITLLKEELTNPDFNKQAEEDAAEDIRSIEESYSDDTNKEDEATSDEDTESTPSPSPIFPKAGTFKRSSGAVEFP